VILKGRLPAGKPDSRWLGKVFQKGERTWSETEWGRMFREDTDICRDLVAKEPKEGKCTSIKIMV
jgi:hypothetical protein